MTVLLPAYALAVLLFVGIDMIWLLGPGRPLYVAEIGGLMRSSPNIPAAMAFYLIYCAGLVYFAVSGAVQSGNPLQALFQGALFGLAAYATYDLTNLAVMNGFTARIAIVDMVWGSLLSGFVAWAISKLCVMLT
jgi:uncharacterized membrane protein